MMKMPTLDLETTDRVIRMAWEDDVSFDAIALQFNLSESQVIALMKQKMKPSSFRMWRKRVIGRVTKHAKKVSNANMATENSLIFLADTNADME